MWLTLEETGGKGMAVTHLSINCELFKSGVYVLFGLSSLSVLITTGLDGKVWTSRANFWYDSRLCLIVSLLLSSFSQHFFIVCPLCHLCLWWPSTTEVGSERGGVSIIWYWLFSFLTGVNVVHFNFKAPPVQSSFCGNMSGNLVILLIKMAPAVYCLRRGCEKEATGGRATSLPSVYALLWPVGSHNGCLALWKRQFSHHVCLKRSPKVTLKRRSFLMG